MFGSKLKTWMENHIVRSKKKNATTQEKEKVKRSSGGGGKGSTLESSESLAQSDTGISSGSQQILSSSNTDNNEGYCTTTMESNRSGMAHCHTAVNLSSPESAYSTGYSTDGTSPGGTGPPEYYINIRSGKHYFPSPAPTPTSPQPPTAFAHLFSANKWTGTPILSRDTAPHSIPTQPFRSSGFPSTRSGAGSVETMPPSSVSLGPDVLVPTFSSFVPISKSKLSVAESTLSVSCRLDGCKSPGSRASPKSPLNSFKLFLKSPKQDKIIKTKSADGRAEALQPGKKASPVRNKKWYKQPFHKFGHRRADSADDTPRKCEGNGPKEFNSSSYFSAKDVASSPRQRNRIRTNPWLPTVEPIFSHNLHNFGTSIPSDPSRNSAPRLRTGSRLEPFRTGFEDQGGASARDGVDDRGSDKPFERRIGRKILLESSDRSDEDLTLDEMMGTYNESYVYEKETDILSDSDPTDCEDYVSDSEADNGGDERDSHDDELDFIDEGSIVEGDRFLDNTGKCTYHDPCPRKNHFLSKGARHRFRSDSDAGKTFRRDASHSKRTKRSADENKKSKSFRRSSRNLQRKASAKSESHPADAVKPGPAKVFDASKLLFRRVNGDSGSKSADGTPICLRRRNLIRQLRRTQVANGDPVDPAEVAHSPIRPLVEDDPETDKRYRQLMQEAETIFAELRNSPVLRSGNREDTPIRSRSLRPRNEEKTGACVRVPAPAAATPKRNLALSLAPVDAVRKPESFLSKSSAHSPLDPLGPALKSLSIFGGIETDASSDESGRSEVPSHPERKTAPSRTGQTAVVPIAFQSVDLGKGFASYCPQSEPVKRKIYSCGKAFDSLAKRLDAETERGESARSSPRGKRNGRPWTGSAEEKTTMSKGVPSVADSGSGNFFYNPMYSPCGSPGSEGNRCGDVENVAGCPKQRYLPDVDAVR